MRFQALVALCVSLVVPLVPWAVADDVIEPADRALVAVDSCQKRIKRTSARFVRKTLSGLEACTSEILDCMQRTPADQSCIAEAGRACRTVLHKLEGEKRRLVKNIRTSCSRRLVSLDEVLSDGGLGYDRVAAECASKFNQPVHDVPAIARCVARQHQCQAEKLFEVERPRARALMSAAGVRVDPISCLAEHDGVGGTARPAAVGKALSRCARKIAKEAATLIDERRAGLDRCVDRVFGCVKLRPDDTGCLEAARIGCNRDFLRMAAADTRLRRGMLQRCSPSVLPFALLAAADVANLAALAPTCEGFGVAPLASVEEYRTCVLRQHTCAVEELVRMAAPRSAELLGLVGHSLSSTFCPISSPSPTRTPEPEGTLTPNATRTPQPGETETPSASATAQPTRTPTPAPTATVVPVCGNNVVEGDEECDGTDLDDNDCADLCDQDEEGGTLGCRGNCTFDFSDCPPPRDCEAP